MVNGMVNVKAGCRLQSNMTSDKPGLTILTVSCNAGSGSAARDGSFMLPLTAVFRRRWIGRMLSWNTWPIFCICHGGYFSTASRAELGRTPIGALDT